MEVRLKRLLIWGASTEEYTKKIQSILKNENCEIVGFVETDIFKWGIAFENIKIFKLEEIKQIEFDFVCIPLGEGHIGVRNMLLEYGIDEHKIIPIFSKKQIYTNEIVNPLDYREYEGLYKNVRDYNTVLDTWMECVNARKEDVICKSWNKDVNLIAHAGGGWIRTKKNIYTNSMEAIVTSISHHFKMIECDLLKIENELYLAHTAGDLHRIKSCNCTIMRFKDLLDILMENKDLSVIIDVKWNTLKSFENYLELMNEQLNSNDEFTKWNIRSRIIIEGYNEETIKLIYREGFRCIHTNYREEDIFEHQEHAALCAAYGITSSIVFFNGWNNLPEKLCNIEEYFKREIYTYVATVNSIDKYSFFLKNGFKGAVTDYLYPVND